MKSLRVILSLLFVFAVSFFVIRGCVKKPLRYTEEKAPVKRALVKETPRVKKAAKKEEKLPPAKAVMAIVLDDWGNNYSLLKYALEIDRPITLSILPGLPQSRRIAEEAHRRGLGVMLHMPMQPMNEKEPREPSTILINSTDGEIQQMLDEALKSVPYAKGVNNHQGSLATSDPRVMRAVLTHLKEKNLFFIDSHVTSRAVAEPIAREVGIAFEKRDVFIDNINKSSAVKEMLREAIRVALAHGRAIVIGHDRKITLKVIRDMLPEMDRAGVKLVLAKDLVEKA